MSRVLFLDIDGPLIPQRAYTMPGQTKPYVTKFDPCAVGFINNACRKQKRKIVLHSSWICTSFISDYIKGDVVDHCVDQGIDKDLFHDTPYCDRDQQDRYARVIKRVNDDSIKDFVILDDEDTQNPFLKSHLILVDFDQGMTMKDFYRLNDGSWS